MDNRHYSKIPILRPPFGLPKTGLISEVVLISNTISSGKYHLGLAKTGLNSEVVLISSGLNSKILLYLRTTPPIPALIKIQSTLVISTLSISNYRLTRRENLVLVLTQKSKIR